MAVARRLRFRRIGVFRIGYLRIVVGRDLREAPGDPFSGESQAGHFSLHARWVFPHRLVGPQAITGPSRWADIARLDQHRAKQVQPVAEEAHAAAMAVSPARAERPVGQRTVSRDQHADGRSLFPVLDVQQQQRAHAGDTRTAHRVPDVDASEHRLVDQLWPGGHGRRPSRICHHLPTSDLRRTTELRIRFSPGVQPGHDDRHQPLAGGPVAGPQYPRRQVGQRAAEVDRLYRGFEPRTAAGRC